jgi:hypothetical protein
MQAVPLNPGFDLESVTHDPGPIRYPSIICFAQTSSECAMTLFTWLRDLSFRQEVEPTMRN